MSGVQKLSLLPATRADLPELLALQHAAFQSEAALYPEVMIAPVAQQLPELEQEFSDWLTLKAELNGVLIGAVRGRRSGEAVEVGRLMVAPAHQGKGYGRVLMSAIEAALPAPAFRLSTGQRSTANLRLYESLGYLRVSRVEISGLVMIELCKTVKKSA